MNEEFDFEKAIRLAQSCLDQEGASQQDKIQTYELLSNCYIALDDTANAASSAAALLEIDRQYDPARKPANRDRFKAMVKTIREKMPPIRKRKSRRADKAYCANQR